MPELPDITVYLEALEKRVLGQQLEKVQIGSPFLLRTATLPVNVIEHKRVVALRRLGKRICFGMEDDDETVVLCDYRRVDSREGLRTGFRSLLWFVSFLANRPDLQLHRLHGLIRPDRTPDGLTPERLAAAYRIFGARRERTVNGEDWMVVDFAEYRQRRKRFQRPAASQEALIHA